MSAYDMAVSDAVYGKSDRYVSKGRLQAMLDREFQLDVDRLGDQRGDETSFFAFADTVVARSYRGGNECHGWMGVKFQSHPRDEPSQVVVHVRMLDDEAALQQEALGVVGVNLLHAAFFLHHQPEDLVERLLDRLTTGRIEIDMIELTGIEFRAVDNRRDFLARADLLAACGMTVLISDYVAYHRLAAYLAWRTDGRIGMVMGVPSLIDLFDEATHAELPGGILEGFGRLLKNDLQLFVYPMLRDDRVVTVDTVAVAEELQPLYDYLARRGSFVGLDNYKPDYLSILSRDVLKRIPTDDTAWESMVPSEVCELIKK